IGAYLSSGVSPEKLGRKIKRIKRINFPEPKLKDGYLIGEIIKFDRFGNGITNLENLPPFEYVQVKRYRIKKVCRSFMEGKENRPNLIKGSFGFYEVFTPKASAKEMFNLKIGDKVKVKLKK
ncbi:MAG: SAM-dependent chlorinase/fluorinase, partial [Aquificae bacterium]|nr:SAM-dependent chlorinase/fluorinase [Aquificota bacterium]